MRVLIADFKQETATFNPVLTRYADFHVAVGPAAVAALADTRTEFAGVLDELQAAGATPVPAWTGWAVSGGPVADADLDRLIDELLQSVQAAGPVDAACIVLHGAMAGETEVDPEGRVLAGIRAVTGPIPLVASLDLHAVLSDRMVANADVLVPYHTYPHIDHYETGRRAARACLAVAGGQVRPVSARVKLPMLVRGDELITATGRFSTAIRMCQEFEAQGGVAAGVLIGNPFTDVPDLRSNAIVTANGDAAAASELADRLADFMWDNREHLQAHPVSLPEAITGAAAAIGAEGVTLFADAADATASGASGDSNAILRGLIEAVYPGTALLPLVDADAARQAHRIGVGATAVFSLGGSLDRGRFTPLQVSCNVTTLTEGRFSYEDQTAEQAGLCAVLRANATGGVPQQGGLHILVTQRPVFFVGQQVFRHAGLEPLALRSRRCSRLPFPGGRGDAATATPDRASGAAAGHRLHL